MRARRRAMEDSYLALQAAKSVHAAMVGVLQLRLQRLASDIDRGTAQADANSAQPLDIASMHALRHWSKSVERLSALEEAYWSIGATTAEAKDVGATDADEVDYWNLVTPPYFCHVYENVKLELIVAALLDMDEVDGAHGALLVSESAKSPDLATRRALAEALAAAPSVWALGSAGMTALQRLSDDDDEAVAKAATEALKELRAQWWQLDTIGGPTSNPRMTSLDDDEANGDLWDL
eukprot:SM000026S08836  [mRNA]  locus=s26:81343:83010:+ [translate_table: standard]